MPFQAWWRRRSRARWLREGLEPAQAEKLAFLPFWSRMPAADRSLLSGWARVFEESKRWEAREGCVLTEEMKAVVAVQACRLVLRLLPPSPHLEPFPRVRVVELHPRAFRPGAGAAWRQGEAWPDGRVVLAWDHAYQGGRDPADGHNVVLHEFAHQLDFHDGAADGLPHLARHDERSRWSACIGRERARLSTELERGAATGLHAYAATDRAEFFAVATEHFFETPRVLRREHPDLYAALAGFYRQDPAA